MSYVFGFGLLLVVGAVVVLFAMFGELYARVGGGNDISGNGYVRLLSDVAVGHAPGSWPPALAGTGTAELGVLLVLSTACNSCEAVARQLATHPEPRELKEFAILLSTSDRRIGEEFLARNKLSALPHQIDVGGTWVSTEFGVRSSPTALVFRGGRLLSALAFTDFGTLRTAVIPEREPA